MVLDNGQMGIHSGEKNIILAFDPGRDKTGFAFVSSDGGLLLSGIFPSSEREEFFAALESGDVSRWVLEGVSDDLMPDVCAIICGNGTSSLEFREYLLKRLGVEALSVDERNTTLEARRLYWKLHRPGLFARLLPEGLRVPGRVIDDLAAWAIGLRMLKI